MKSFIYKFFLKIYKFSPFKKQLCLFLRAIGVSSPKIINELIFKGVIKVDAGNGLSFKMKSYGGAIVHKTFWDGLFVSFENDTGWCWKELCKFSDTILDVGANVGIYSLVTKAINPNAVVYAFEPSNNTYHKLKENNAINGFDIVCKQNAVSKEKGVLTFYDVPNEHQTSASLSPDKLKNFSSYEGEIVEYDVDVIDLDSFIDTNNILKVDLVKIDVELHEPEIIRGFDKYLNKFKPIVFIEVLTDEIANELNSLIDLNNYCIYHLRGEGKVVQQDKFTQHSGLMNFVIFHKDKKAFIDSKTNIFS